MLVILRNAIYLIIIYIQLHDFFTKEILLCLYFLEIDSRGEDKVSFNEVKGISQEDLKVLMCRKKKYAKHTAH